MEIKQRSPHTSRVVVITSSEEAEPLITLFEEIASDEGWQPEGELRAYVDPSIYVAVYEDSDPLIPIGGMQLVRPDASGFLPCQKVWPEMDFAERSELAYIAVLAVRKEWRARGEMGGLFWILAVQMWLYCVEAGIKELRLEATPRTLRCYERLGWPLKIEGPLRVHWGEECYPCSLGVRDVAGELVQRAVRSQTHRLIVAQAFGFETGGVTAAREGGAGSATLTLCARR